MKIDLNKREEYETHIHDKSGGMLAIWIGHTTGSFYGNFSYRKNGITYQKKRGFHLRREMFNFYLNLPLNWKKIIDCTIKYGKNTANTGINLSTGEFKNRPTPIEKLSIKDKEE